MVVIRKCVSASVEEHVHVFVVYWLLRGLCLLPVYLEDTSFPNSFFIYRLFFLVDYIADTCFHVSSELLLAIIYHIQEVFFQMSYFSHSLLLYLSLKGTHLLHLLLQSSPFLLYAFLFACIFLLELHEESSHMGHRECSIYAEHVDLKDADIDAWLYLANEAELGGHGGVFFLSEF